MAALGRKLAIGQKGCPTGRPLCFTIADEPPHSYEADKADTLPSPHAYGIAAFAAFDLRSSSIPFNVTAKIREHSRQIA